jgi:hypothetical protein
MTGFPEPPAVGTEADTLVGSLERQRSTFRYKTADLGEDGLSREMGPSTLTLAGLLKHMAYMEDLNFTAELAGDPLPAPWSGVEADTRSEWVWRSAADDAPAELYRLWDDAVARSRRAIDRALSASGLAGTYDSANGHQVSLRRLLVDMIEEYGRHTGHADLLREAVDGRVGEDPPGDPYPYSSATRADLDAGR